MDYKIRQIQFAIFPKNFSLSDKIKLATDLKIKTSNLFDGEPTIWSLPIDAPLEIPRIILPSKDGKYVCNISLQRIDLLFNLSNEGDVDIAGNISLAKDTAGKIAGYFINDLGISIGRIGFVTTFIATTVSEANLFMKDTLLTKSKLVNRRNLRTLSVVVNDTDKIDAYEISRIIQIGTLQKPDRSESKSVLIMCDSNTLAEKFQDYNLSAENIHTILDNVSASLIPEKLNELFETIS